MPTYEFRCSECAHITDFFCGFDERPDSILCCECDAKAPYQISCGGTPIIKGVALQGETIGDLLDAAGVDTNSQKYKDAS